MVFGKKKVDCKKNPHNSKCNRSSIKRERERSSGSRLNCSLDKNKKLKQCKARPKPLMPYFGGKQRVADKIISQFPDHEVYVEPFVGGGSIYWKNTIPEKFVINDLNKDVYNIYKTAKNNPSSINRCEINSGKERFNRIKNKGNKSACDVIVLHRNGFGGLPKSHTRQSRVHKNQFSNQHLEKLKKTTVLNKDYKTIIKQYGHNKDTLFYLDPPYVEAGTSYVTHGVTPEEVCNVAKKIKGKVAISYDNNSKVRKACKGLKHRKIIVPYSAKKGKTVRKQELLITNY